MALLPIGTIKKLCPALHTVRAANIEKYINDICPQYGITTGDISHEFLSNLMHECSCFTRYEESLNYSVEALIKTFGRHRISIEQANTYGRSTEHAADQKKIGNTIYGGQWGKDNLGNTQPDDGWELRGSGPIQLTGRTMFEKFASHMRTKFGINKTIYEWAELLRTSDEYGIHSACWFFAIAKNLIQLAIDDQMKVIVKRINGGYSGLDERQKIYEKCKELIPA